jgi:hypothetical protein
MTKPLKTGTGVRYQSVVKTWLGIRAALLDDYNRYGYLELSRVAELLGTTCSGLSQKLRTAEKYGLLAKETLSIMYKPYGPVHRYDSFLEEDYMDLMDERASEMGMSRYEFGAWCIRQQFPEVPKRPFNI